MQASVPISIAARSRSASCLVILIKLTSLHSDQRSALDQADANQASPGFERSKETCPCLQHAHPPTCSEAFSGDGHARQVQAASEGFGDLATFDAFLADRVIACARFRSFQDESLGPSRHLHSYAYQRGVAARPRIPALFFRHHRGVV
jgi:hypothetical protein